MVNNYKIEDKSFLSTMFIITFYLSVLQSQFKATKMTYQIVDFKIKKSNLHTLKMFKLYVKHLIKKYLKWYIDKAQIILCKIQKHNNLINTNFIAFLSNTYILLAIVRKHITILQEHQTTSIYLCFLSLVFLTMAHRAVYHLFLAILFFLQEFEDLCQHL